MRRSKGGQFVYTGQFFQVVVFLQAHYLVSFSLTYPGTFPWVCMHPSAKMDLKGFWEEPRLTVAWHYSSNFLTHKKEPFCACVASPLSETRGRRALNPLFHTGFCPLFVLALIGAMTITLTCLQKTNVAILPCFCCYFHFGGQGG